MLPCQSWNNFLSIQGGLLLCKLIHAGIEVNREALDHFEAEKTTSHIVFSQNYLVTLIQAAYLVFNYHVF